MTPTPWATPTPFPVGITTPVIQFDEGGVQIAEGMVQGWHTLNASGAISVLMFLFILILIGVGIWSVIHRLQSV